MLNLKTDFEQITEPFAISLAQGLLDPADVAALYRSAPLHQIRRTQNVDPDHEKQYAMNILYLMEDDRRCEVPDLPPIWARLVDELTAPEFTAWLERGTGLPLAELQTDIAIYTHGDGDFISVHKDKPHKAITAILYLNERWPAEYGGNYEVRTSPDPSVPPARLIAPQPGQLLAFPPRPNSWHAVSEVTTGGQATRLTVQWEIWYEKKPIDGSSRWTE